MDKINRSHSKSSNLIVAGMLLFTFFSISLLTRIIFPVDNLILLAVLFFTTILILFIRSTYVKVIRVSLVILLGGLLSAVYWGLTDMWSFVLVSAQGLTLAISLLFVNSLKNEEIYMFAKLASQFLLVLTVLCIASFFYAYNGGNSAETFHISAGNKFDFYLFTFVKDSWSNIIRPTAIWDEPGAFSFVICFIVTIREIFGFSKSFSLLLLILGGITFSLAHYFFLFLFLLTYRTRSLWTIGLVFVLIVISLILIVPGLAASFQSLILSRLILTDGSAQGLFQGDNRTILALNAYEMLDVKSVIFGKDALFVVDKSTAMKTYGRCGENPLWPLIKGGLLNSWFYYYVFILYALSGIRSRSSLYLLGFAFLILQRPYVYDLGYSIMILLPQLFIKNGKISIDNNCSL